MINTIPVFLKYGEGIPGIRVTWGLVKSADS